MKYILNLLPILLMMTGCSPNNSEPTTAPQEIPSASGEAYALAWKIPASDTLVYQTVMEEIDPVKFDATFGDFFEEAEEEDFEFEADAFFKKYRTAFQNTTFTTFMTESPYFDEVIDIEVVGRNDAAQTPTNQPFPSRMFSGTMLRGSVHTDGRIHSFWVTSRQKNLISLFFELPDVPVSVGDSWELDAVSFIGNDQSFTCQEARRRNQITFKKLLQQDGEAVALIEYDLYEYVNGVLKVPAFDSDKAGTDRKSEITFSFKGQAEFSLERGHWLAYSGLLSIDMTGTSASASRQRLSLVLD